MSTIGAAATTMLYEELSRRAPGRQLAPVLLNGFLGQGESTLVVIGTQAGRSVGVLGYYEELTLRVVTAFIWGGLIRPHPEPTQFDPCDPGAVASAASLFLAILERQ